MQTLIPQELLDKLPNLYDTENTKDPICHIKLFTPDSNWTFYILEFSKVMNKISHKKVSTVFKQFMYHSLFKGLYP